MHSPADHEKQLQHASIVRGPGADINGDEFWRGSTPQLVPVVQSVSSREVVEQRLHSTGRAASYFDVRASHLSPLLGT
jgi:hypothetical protein